MTPAPLIAFVLCLGLTSAAFGQTTMPEAGDPLATLIPQHPRLNATPADIERVREGIETDQTLRRWYEAVAKKARDLLNAPPVRHELPDKVRLLSVSRTVVDRAYTLGLVYRIEKDRDPELAERIKDRLWLELETAAGFPDWNPSHFLDVGEMAHGVGIGLDWLWEEWTPEQRQHLADAIDRHALQPGLKAIANEAWWHKNAYNWNQVCNGGLAVGALAVADLKPEAATATLRNSIEGLPYALTSYDVDGAWEEGLGYWVYATNYTAYGLHAMQTALGTDFGLSDRDNLRKAWQFPRHLVGPTGRAFNFADAGEGFGGAVCLWWLADRYDAPAAAKLQHRYAEQRPTALDVVWGASFEPTQVEEPPTDKLFEKAGIVSMRTAWTPDAAWLAVKAGRNGVNHGQLDLGTFVYERDGVRWFVETGRDNYNLPGYFNAKRCGRRWTYYRNRTEGHNTLVLNPADGGGQLIEGRANVDAFDGNTLRLDLSSAYGHNVHRTFEFDDRGDLNLTDVVTGDPADLWWFAHTRADVKLSEDGHEATLSQDGKTLTVRLSAPEDARFELMQATPLPVSPAPEGQNPNSEFRKLAIHLPDAADVSIKVHIGKE